MGATPIQYKMIEHDQIKYETFTQQNQIKDPVSYVLETWYFGNNGVTKRRGGGVYQKKYTSIYCVVNL